MDLDISVRLTHFLLLKRRRHPVIIFALRGREWVHKNGNLCK